MHKHLTGALATDSRHDHRLKTTLLSKKAGAAASSSLTSTEQYAGYAAASVGAGLQYTYSQTDQPYAYQQQDAAAGPLHSSMQRSAGPGSLRNSGSYPELPVSQHASSSAPVAAAAASRLNVALAAAMSTSPSKTRDGKQYAGYQQQHETSGSPRDYSPRQYSNNQQPGQQQYLQQQQQCGRGPNGNEQGAQYYPQVPTYDGQGFTATGALPAGYMPQQNNSWAGDAQQPAGAATAAAAVHLAAGVSLMTETVTSAGTPAAAALKKKKSGSLFSKSSKKQQQQQPQLQKPEQVQSPPLQDQGHNSSRRKTSTTTFGMRLSGSVMAAFNGWLVNEAMIAAASAATAAFAEPAADNGAAVAGQSGPGITRCGSQGEDGAAGATTTPSKWSLAGLLACTTSLEKQQQQQAGQRSLGGSELGTNTAKRHRTAVQSQDSISSMDEEYMPEDEHQLGRSSSGSTHDSDLGDVDAINSDYEAEAAALAAAASGGSRRRKRLAGAVAAALGLHSRSSSESSFVFVQRPDVARKVKAVRGVLLWHDSSASWKALGLGLYLVMLVGYIPQALHYMQLTTLLPGVALVYLAFNLVKPWAIRGYCKVAGRSAGPIAVKLASLEASAAEYMIQLSSRAATELGIWALAVLSLAHRALRGQRFTTSAWTILSLWLLLLISELRVFNQTLLAMMAYAGLFSVPWLYNKFKRSIDTVVYETMHFLTLLVVHAERWAYGVALLAGGLIWQLLESEEGSLVVRGSAAGLAAMAVLVWRVAVAEP